MSSKILVVYPTILQEQLDRIQWLDKLICYSRILEINTKFGHFFYENEPAQAKQQTRILCHLR